jgi:hypothetical protein
MPDHARIFFDHLEVDLDRRPAAPSRSATTSSG